MELFLKTISEINRIRIINLLANGRFSVGEITNILECSQSLVSHHLKVLLSGGIVTQYRHGRMMFYSLSVSLGRHEQAVIDDLLGWCAEDRTCQLDIMRGKNLLRLRHNQSKEFFAHHAPQWDSLSSTFIDFEKSVSLLKKFFSSEHCATIIDLGTGTGRLIKPLLEFAKKVVGVDNSYAMLEQARSKIKTDSAEFRLGELEHLPFQDSFSDGAVIHYVLHHCVQPELIFPEVNRVLKTGGIFVLFDFLHHAQEYFCWTMGDLWLGFNDEELKGWFEKGGFKIEDKVKFPTLHEGISSIAIKAKKI